MLYQITKIVAYVHEYFHTNFNFNIRGLGFLYRQFKTDRYLNVNGGKLFFNHKIADNYGRLINGRYNEPETHIFIDKAISILDSKCIFVEVGGNIGEFVIDYSMNAKVEKIYVFEPQPEQSKSIENTININNFNKTVLVKKPVYSSEQDIIFNIPENNASSAGITNSTLGGLKMITTTLDAKIESNKLPHIVLIDVEGAELEVLKGGINLIRDNRPLIIFEYNFVSKKSFHYKEVQNFLGDDYKIFRLNRKGLIDNELDNAWNLVAINCNSAFSKLL
jgi:FkbM family methyltransferase